MRFYLFNPIDHSVQVATPHMWYARAGANQGDVLAMGNVLKTPISDEVLVSTAFLGIDHNSFGGEPEIFETMIFGGRFDLLSIRCSSSQEAEINHQKFVKMVQQDALEAATTGIQQELELRHA